MATPNKVIEIRVPGPSGPIGPQGPAGSGNAFVDALGNGNFITFITQNGNPVPILFSNFLGVAQTSSMLVPYVLNSQTSSFVLNSQTGSMTVLSSSYALTASYALNSVGGFTPSLTTDLPARNITASIISASGILSIGGIPNVSASIASLNTGTGNLQTVTTNGASTTIPITASIISASSFTGSLFGTASWATNARTASFLPVGTYNITASWAQSASNAINARTASFLPTGTYNITASWAQSASNALNSWTISDGITSESVGSNTVIGFIGGGGTTVSYNTNRNELSISTTNYEAGIALDLNGSTFDVDLTELTSSTTITSSNSFVIISGSNQRLISASLIGLNIFNNNLTRFNSPITASIISASNGITGSLLGTASWATNALTASYVLNAVSSSFATTSSHALNGGVTSISAGDGIAINQSTGNVTITSTGGGGSVGTLSQVTALGASTTTPITASIISASNSITGSLFGTASWAISASQAISSSYAFNATSASHALTASYVNPLLQNVIITGSLLVTQSSISTIDYIDFDINAVPAFQTGRVNWVDDTKTLAIDTELSGFQIEVGHQNIIRVRNNTGATILRGRAVYISGSSGNRPLIYTSSYEIDPTSAGTVGLVATDISDNNNGYVISNGLIRDINTNAYTAGQVLYLSSSGQLGTTPPVAPLHGVRMGKVITVGNDGIIHVDVDNGYEIGELHDVVDNTTNTTYGSLLVKSGSVWKDGYQLTGSYGLTGSLNATSFTGSLQGTASWATNSITASYVLNAISSSFASTASFVQNAQSASYVLNSVTASYVLNAVSSSFSLTSSLANRNILTASVNSNTLFFTKGDGTQFSLTVNTGSGAGGGVTIVGDNNAGNLITATGTDEIYGEVDLTFKSPVLSVNNGIVATKFIRFSSSLNIGSSNGLIINYGSTSTVEGYLYYLSSSNVWVTSSLTLTSGSLLAIATSTNSSGGMLLQGISAHPDLNNLTPGATIYLSGSGRVSQIAPTTSNQQVRVIGYGLSGSTFVFNPSTEYVTLA